MYLQYHQSILLWISTWFISGADKRDEMSFRKNRPKCSPIHFYQNLNITG
jgi:hypothetical protein